MKFKVLLYVGLFISLTGCTGVIGKNGSSPNKAQKIRPLENNPYQSKSNPRTERTLAWIELSKG